MEEILSRYSQEISSIKLEKNVPADPSRPSQTEESPPVQPQAPEAGLLPESPIKLRFGEIRSRIRKEMEGLSGSDSPAPVPADLAAAEEPLVEGPWARALAWLGRSPHEGIRASPARLAGRLNSLEAKIAVLIERQLAAQEASEALASTILTLEGKLHRLSELTQSFLDSASGPAR